MVIITDVAQAVEELVCNSIDAGAKNIDVFTDLPNFAFSVLDDGIGLTREALEKIPQRYYTSKCHSIEDINERIHTLGWRGEALASLCEVGTLEIISRSRIPQPNGKIAGAFRKVITGGEPVVRTVDGIQLPTTSPVMYDAPYGTRINVTNFLQSLPVRQAMFRPRIEAERVRSRIDLLSLAHPSISIRLNPPAFPPTAPLSVPHHPKLMNLFDSHDASTPPDFKSIVEVFSRQVSANLSEFLLPFSSDAAWFQAGLDYLRTTALCNVSLRSSTLPSEETHRGSSTMFKVFGAVIRPELFTVQLGGIDTKLAATIPLHSSMPLPLQIAAALLPSSRDLQFVFLNGRPVRLRHAVQTIEKWVTRFYTDKDGASRPLSSTQRGDDNDAQASNDDNDEEEDEDATPNFDEEDGVLASSKKMPSPSVTSMISTRSVKSGTRPSRAVTGTKNFRKHPVILLYVYAPPAEFDVTLEPNKREVHFASWSPLAHALDMAKAIFEAHFPNDRSSLLNTSVSSTSSSSSSVSTPEQDAEVSDYGHPPDAEEASTPRTSDSSLPAMAATTLFGDDTASTSANAPSVIDTQNSSAVPSITSTSINQDIHQCDFRADGANESGVPPSNQYQSQPFAVEDPLCITFSLTDEGIKSEVHRGNELPQPVIYAETSQSDSTQGGELENMSRRANEAWGVQLTKFRSLGSLPLVGIESETRTSDPGRDGNLPTSCNAGENANSSGVTTEETLTSPSKKPAISIYQRLMSPRQKTPGKSPAQAANNTSQATAAELRTPVANSGKSTVMPRPQPPSVRQLLASWSQRGIWSSSPFHSDFTSPTTNVFTQKASQVAAVESAAHEPALGGKREREARAEEVGTSVNNETEDTTQVPQMTDKTDEVIEEIKMLIPASDLYSRQEDESKPSNAEQPVPAVPTSTNHKHDSSRLQAHVLRIQNQLRHGNIISSSMASASAETRTTEAQLRLRLRQARPTSAPSEPMDDGVTVAPSLPLLHSSSTAALLSGWTAASTSVVFTSELLRHPELRVLGQVDCKFILCVIPAPETSSADVESKCSSCGKALSGSMLVAIDQHAADERVRLEALLADESELLSSYQLVEPVRIPLIDVLYRALLSHRDRIATWGWTISLHPRGRTSSNSDGTQQIYWIGNSEDEADSMSLSPDVIDSLQPCEMWVHSVPSVDGVPLDPLKDLSDFLQVLSDAGDIVDSSIHLKPPAVQRILNYRACHSAVKFGDPLSPAEQERLLQQLSTCKFPFNCAHGRPSLSPIIVIPAANQRCKCTAVEVQSTSSPQPNLQLSIQTSFRSIAVRR